MWLTRSKLRRMIRREICRQGRLAIREADRAKAASLVTITGRGVALGPDEIANLRRAAGLPVVGIVR
jgi:hypothetical protein